MFVRTQLASCGPRRNAMRGGHASGGRRPMAVDCAGAASRPNALYLGWPRPRPTVWVARASAGPAANLRVFLPVTARLLVHAPASRYSRPGFCFPRPFCNRCWTTRWGRRHERTRDQMQVYCWSYNAVGGHDDHQHSQWLST